MLKKMLAEHSELPDTIDYDSVMEHMAFTESCARESIRRDPPLVVLMRKAMVEHKVGDFVIPKGDILACSPLLNHCDEAYFPDHRKWNPERNVNPNAYIAFGAGVHRCMGEKFGLLQVKTILFTLFRDLELEPCVPLPEPDYHTMVSGPIKAQCEIKWTRRPTKRN